MSDKPQSRVMDGVTSEIKLTETALVLLEAVKVADFNRTHSVFDCCCLRVAIDSINVGKYRVIASAPGETHIVTFARNICCRKHAWVISNFLRSPKERLWGMNESTISALNEDCENEGY